MRLYIKLLISAYLSIFLLSIITWYLSQEGIILFIGLMTSMVVTIQSLTYQQIKEGHNAQIRIARENYIQTEAMFSIFSLLRLNGPLPSMSEYAAYPDLVNLIIKILHEKKPQIVVELGSGVSTLIIAYYLKQTGGGKLISLEHDKEYAEFSQNYLISHGLNEIATIRYSPLEKITVDSKEWQWYSTEQIKDLKNIDVLIVDGPPLFVGDMARYPAIPLLFNALSIDAVILLDDGNRADETRIARLWEEWNGNILKAEKIETFKGAYIIRKTG